MNYNTISGFDDEAINLLALEELAPIVAACAQPHLTTARPMACSTTSASNDVPTCTVIVTPLCRAAPLPPTLRVPVIASTALCSIISLRVAA